MLNHKVRKIMRLTLKGERLVSELESKNCQTSCTECAKKCKTYKRIRRWERKLQKIYLNEGSGENEEY